MEMGKWKITTFERVLNLLQHSFFLTNDYLIRINHRVKIELSDKYLVYFLTQIVMFNDLL
jgi:hypothetical protein